MEHEDIIAAVATPPGTGGVAIIRVSGPDSSKILSKVFSLKGEFSHGVMHYGSVVENGAEIDRGYAVVFYAPHSYTGEETFELQVHGGAMTARQVLEAVLAAGARPAEPGEFTRRAFINGRMDLAQAQAVGDLISALSRAGAKLALRQTRPLLHDVLEGVYDELCDLTAQTQAVLEYPEEDIEDLASEERISALRGRASQLCAIAESADDGRKIRDGLRVTLAGAANAGKSSLFNALLGEHAAIVTEIPGTTRDRLEAKLEVRGAGIALSDTAGLRQTDDVVEMAGVERAIDAMQMSDLILFVVDGSKPPTEEDVHAKEEVVKSGCPVVCVLSKADQGRDEAAAAFSHDGFQERTISVSVVTGEGLNSIRDVLYAYSGADRLAEETIVLSDLRQKRHIEEAARCCERAAELLENCGDLDCACMEMEAACREIGYVTGRNANEELIDRIFSKFCLGK